MRASRRLMACILLAAVALPASSAMAAAPQAPVPGASASSGEPDEASRPAPVPRSRAPLCVPCTGIHCAGVTTACEGQESRHVVPGRQAVRASRPNRTKNQPQGSWGSGRSGPRVEQVAEHGEPRTSPPGVNGNADTRPAIEASGEGPRPDPKPVATVCGVPAGSRCCEP